MSAQPERWLVLTVRTADPELLPLASEVLVARGSWAVQEADGAWRVVGGHVSAVPPAAPSDADSPAP